MVLECDERGGRKVVITYVCLFVIVAEERMEEYDVVTSARAIPVCIGIVKGLVTEQN